MSSGFYDNNVDVGDVYVTRDWLISRYPDLSGNLLFNLQKRIGFAGRGYTGNSPYTLVSTSEQVAPAGVLNENAARGQWSTFARNGSAGIKADGTLWSWGNNLFGQRGDASFTSRSSPVQVSIAQTASWKFVAATDNRAGGIDVSNKLYTWGLALGATSAQANYSWSNISAGNYDVWAVRSDGTLWRWGDDGSGAYRSIPTQLGTDSDWASATTFRAGFFTAVNSGIKTDGSLWMWGDNTYGQLGLGDTANRGTPTKIGNNSWVMVTFDRFAYATLAIRSDGALFGWGLNSGGMFGDGTYNSRSSPVQIGTSSWSMVKAVEKAVVAIRSDGALFTWGDSSYSGLLGRNTVGTDLSPVQVGTSSWSFVTGGHSTGGTGDDAYVIAKRADGTLWGWGRGTYSQLGLGGPTRHTGYSSPVQISTSSWTTVNSATGFTVAQKATGGMWGWGKNDYGQLGPNAITPVRSWSFVGGTPNWNPASITGAKTLFAITNTGALYRTGDNNAGSMGITSGSFGTPPLNYDTVLENYDTQSWSFIAHSDNQAVLAIRSDKTLWGWGHNSSGELGLSDRVHRSSLVQVSTSSWTSVSIQNSTAAAIRSDGALFMWGSNNLGQLPFRPFTPASWTSVFASTTAEVPTYAIRTDGTLWGWGYNRGVWTGDLLLQAAIFGNQYHLQFSSPVQVGTGSWKSVASAEYVHFLGITYNNWYTYAIRSDDTLWFWGLFGAGQHGGQAGDGNAFGTYSSPIQIGTSSWSVICASRGTTLAIRKDGTLWAWGNNEYGLFGDNTLNDASSPVQIGTSSWTMLSMLGGFSGHVLAIRSDGQLFAWGYNVDGQLGQSDVTRRSSPVNIGTSSWTQVSVGQSMSQAIRSDGRLFAWGWNGDGGLGQNDRVHRSSPVNIGTSSWTQVNAGRAIRSDGTLWVWGGNGFGRLGLGDQASRSSPVQLGSSSWSQLQSTSGEGFGGNPRSFAIRSDGMLFSWGDNTYGPLGIYDTISRSSPVLVGAQADYRSYSSPVQIGTSSWTQVITGRYTQAIRKDGGLFTWGDNTYGQLGQNDLVHRSSPVQIGTSSWSSVAGGPYHALAIRSDGRLFTWGYNDYGELGQGDRVHRSSPVQIDTTTSWNIISATDRRSFAIRKDSALFVWGNNVEGILGINATGHRSSPVQVGTSSWTLVVGNGLYNAYAIRTDGALFTWGANATYSSSGLGSRSIEGSTWRSSPVMIGGQRADTVLTPTQIFSETWDKVALNTGEYLGLIRNNSVYMLGYNLRANLGDGTFINRSSPVLLGAPNAYVPQVFTGYGSNQTARSFDMGPSHMMVVRSDGTLWAQGLNTSGQLGLNNTTEVAGAQQVGTLSNWSVVSCGTDHTLAIKTNGTLWGWGVNNYGQVGDGFTGNVSSPVQLGLLTNWRSICAGSRVSSALTTDNKLYMWGRNDFGQIGDGTAVSRSSPVQIGASVWAKSILFNRDDIQSSYVIDTAGNLFAWGQNANNSLGVTSTPHRSSPVQIATAGYGVLDVFSANNTGVGVYVVTDGGTL